jgi:hypothetical protein
MPQLMEKVHPSVLSLSKHCPSSLASHRREKQSFDKLRMDGIGYQPAVAGADSGKKGMAAWNKVPVSGRKKVYCPAMLPVGVPSGQPET